MEYSLEQLSAVWHWAKANTNVPHEAVDKHIQNLTDALHKGRDIIPCLDIDTDGTLTRFRPPEYNRNLFEFGVSIQENSADELHRDTIICSSALGLAVDTAYHFDPNFYNIADKKTIHPHDAKNDFLREMLIDDRARISRYKNKYVSIVAPTWDKGLITFPKLT